MYREEPGRLYCFRFESTGFSCLGLDHMWPLGIWETGLVASSCWVSALLDPSRWWTCFPGLSCSARMQHRCADNLQNNCQSIMNEREPPNTQDCPSQHQILIINHGEAWARMAGFWWSRLMQRLQWEPPVTCLTSPSLPAMGAVAPFDLSSDCKGAAVTGLRYSQGSLDLPGFHVALRISVDSSHAPPHRLVFSGSLLYPLFSWKPPRLMMPV